MLNFELPAPPYISFTKTKRVGLCSIFVVSKTPSWTVVCITGMDGLKTKDFLDPVWFTMYTPYKYGLIRQRRNNALSPFQSEETRFVGGTRFAPNQS